MSRSLVADRLAELGTRFNEYQGLVERVRAAVDEVVPPASTVLVVTKGDSALLGFSRHTGWHFPRAMDGQYAGFHPADSNDAIARLDLERGLGARYLVIPATSAWWFNHYPEFIAHVRSSGRPLIEDASVAWIFELAAKAASPPPHDAGSGERPGLITQQLIALLEAVLPASATVAVIAAKANDLIGISPLPAFVFRYTDDPAIDSLAAITDLRAIADGIAEFLVVPAASREWLTDQPDLAAHIDVCYPLVTDQRNVCAIYDLRSRRGASP